MTYTCLIVDDEELARELIETHLAPLNNFELVASCASAIEASTILQQQSIDLMFLDIEMPVLKGTDFFKNLLHKPKVIFTTAYRDYALDGFELDAVDYLLKPIVFQRFFKAIEKFIASQKKESPPTLPPPTSINTTTENSFLFIKKNRKQVKIKLDEIIYIESLKDYIKIYLDTENHVVKYSISSFEKKLDHRFIRVHRSYIVNRNKVTAYTKNDIEINTIEIPIGGNYKNSISNLLV
ncbi:LytR/AlgR family response regulator transcription factor [Aquimarina longa]|uniref:LytR/AlgR family response regulator transcription factor n=1 Tax=Aquimarina longa TaxID=1080221 RepID=UPI0007848519|nr:LytTR family DNA-binding domain-containing protein [Aquimarina longa]